MSQALLVLSFLGHVLFFIGLVGDHSPNGNRALKTGDNLALLAVQLLGLIALSCAIWGDPRWARFFLVPVVVAHAWGFKLWRRRGQAPEATPGFRAFEDIAYGINAALAGAALMLVQL